MISLSSGRRGLYAPNRRHPGLYAIVVEPRLKPVALDGDDVPPTERRSQLVLADRVRTGLGTLVAEAEHEYGSAGLGHRRETADVSRPLGGVDGGEQPAVEHRVEPTSQTLQRERVRDGEFDV